MKIICCGGRDYSVGPIELGVLALIHKAFGITEIVSGGCAGVDNDCEVWARLHNIPIKRFIPEWVALGKKAGPLRNQEMAEYADACIAFTGGKGTDDMFNRAKKEGLRLFDFRNRTNQGGK